MNATEPSCVVIYTDGGATPNPGLGGWAAIHISPAHDNRTREIYGSEPNTTNNRMELTAALMALKALKFPCRVELFTDSQYLRNAFTKGWLTGWQKNGWRTSNKTPVLNQDLWSELLALTAVHQVEWKWTRGHAENPYNNRCDELVQLAKERNRTA
jgi:ribonuclease HI